MPKKESTATKQPAPKKKSPPKAAAREKKLIKKVPVAAPKAKKKPIPKAEKAVPAALEQVKKEAKKPAGGDKQKVRVLIFAFDHKIVDESAKTIIETAERTGSLVTGAIPLPTKRELFTLNRSTFVHKDSREQFEIRTHKRLIDITECTGTTIEALSNLNLPAGVDVEIKMI